MKNEKLRKVKDSDLESALFCLQKYINITACVYFNLVKNGKYKTIKTSDLVKKGNKPYDYNRRPKASSRLDNTIILAQIKSSFLILDGNHRVIQYIRLGRKYINTFIIKIEKGVDNKRIVDYKIV